MMNIRANSLATWVAKNRWVRRLGVLTTPDIGYVNWRSWKFFVYLKDWSGPSFHVLRWGVDSYENHAYETLKLLATPQSVFIDIGANIGIFSFRLVRDIPGIQIFGFEPESFAFSCIEKTIVANNIKNISAYKVAVSDKATSAVLFSDGANAGGHSLDAQSILGDGSTISAENIVSTTSLDIFSLDKNLNRLDLVKIDVQRHELSVLKGAVQTFKKFRPIVLMECYLAELEDSEKTLFKPFLDLGNYKIFDPISSRTYSFDELSLIAKNAKGDYYRDLFFVPNEKINLLPKV
ncbi:MAG TPA: FkbM family methyltransferase [Bdellovibrio sp.]|nr:FkbM family methyltransferase [Bdellovibrio sp.]